MFNTEEGWRYVGSRFLSCEVAFLRLERTGDSFTAYCSGNGTDWILCEEVKYPVSDPVEVGLYAIGAIVRTAIGTVDTTTSAMFDYFKIFNKGGVAK